MRYVRLSALCAVVVVLLTGCRDTYLTVKNDNDNDNRGGSATVVQITTSGPTDLYPECIPPVQPRTVTFTADQAVVWSATPAGVVTFESRTDSTVVVRGFAPGTATVIATPRGGSDDVGTEEVTVHPCPNVPGPQTRTIDLVPDGASGQVGTTLQLSAICRINGVATTSCNPYWTSNKPSNVSVNPNTGEITFVSSGTAEVCVWWSRDQLPKDCSTFTATSVPNPVTTTVTISPSNPTISLGTVGGACVAQIQFSAIVTNSDGSSVSQAVTWQPFGGGSISASGVFQATAPGVYTIRATGANGAIGTTTVRVEGSCSTQPPTFTVTPLTLNLRMPGCPAVGPSVGSIDTNLPATFVPNNSGVASVTQTNSTRGTVSSTSVGQTNVVVTPTGGGQPVNVSVMVFACPAAPTPIVVTVVPDSDTCPVGQQAVFDAHVANVPAGQSDAVIWSSSDPAVASITHTSSNSAVVACHSVGSASITARAVADQSASDYGNLNVTAVTAGGCTVTSVSYSSSSGYSLGVQESRLVSTNPMANWSPTQCGAIWYTPHTSRAGVISVDTVRVDGVLFHEGPNARVEGVYQGTADIYVHIISKRSDGKWERTNVFSFRTWTITATSGITAQSAQAVDDTEWIEDAPIDYEAQRKWIERFHGPIRK